MKAKTVLLIAMSMFAATAASAQAVGSQTWIPDLSGTYRCVPEPSSCRWQEQNPTISQTGMTLQLNINKGEFAEGKLTSNITVGAGPPFNSLGLIRPDHSIEWSNGTKWIKQ